MPASDRNSSQALPLLPQMVPSATCFRCDVCCRFPEADSFLRPYFTEQEIIESVARGIDPAHFPDRRGGQVSLVPNPTGEGFLCPAFDSATSHCRIYEGRPLDCRLYPLAVMWSDPLTPALSPKGRGGGEGGEGLSEIGGRRESSPFATNPRLIGRFQDDVLIIRRLLAVTARLWGRGERSGKSGTSETRDLRVAPVSPVSPVAGIITRPFTIADRSRLEQACESIDTALAAYALAPHLIWRDLFTYTWAEVDGHFCLFAEYVDGVYMPLPPLPAAAGRRHEAIGDRPESAPLPIAHCPSPAALAACFASMHEKNRGSAVSRIENVPIEWTAGFKTMGYRMTAKDPDYLYRTADLAALAGDSYKSQRAACNRVLREHRCEIGVYRPEHREACLALFRRWRQQQEARSIDGVARHMLGDAESAHREALTRPDALGLLGWVVWVDGEVLAYTFGYARSRSVFCVLLEVADRTVTGLAPFIFRECCREAAANGFTFINTMDDSGLPYLAAAKRAYHPLRLVPSSIATLP
ncbi:MAG: GNAT family N-acetyltransferase [Nitrospirae bacterium]|nr:GNAT family N-acetyltransferase [Nitrospirota bacterium]